MDFYAARSLKREYAEVAKERRKAIRLMLGWQNKLKARLEQDPSSLKPETREAQEYVRQWENKAGECEQRMARLEEKAVAAAW